MCREPEELTKTLSEQLGEFLEFFQFYIIVYRENSADVEWAVLGSEKSLISAYADVPVQQRPSWHAYAAQEPFHIADWDTDERVPARLKEGIAAQGLEIGPLVFVPLTTPHRRLGALGMSGFPGTVYSSDDISFLRLIGRVVAFAIDDNFNLRKAEAAQAELQRQNDRLRLLLKLTNQITSKLELREVLRAISANIREVMHGDAVHISLPDAASGKFRVYALDFPEGKGFVKEEMLITPVGAVKRALEKLEPAVRSTDDREEFPPDYYELLVAEGVKTSMRDTACEPGSERSELWRSPGPQTIPSCRMRSTSSKRLQVRSRSPLRIASHTARFRELKENSAQEKLYLEEEIRSGHGFRADCGEQPGAQASSGTGRNRCAQRFDRSVARRNRNR